MDKNELERRLEAAEKQNIGFLDEIKYLKEPLAEMPDEPEIPDFPEFATRETYWCAGLDLKHVDSGCAAGGTIYGDYNCFHTKEMAQEFAKKCKLIAMMMHCKSYLCPDYVPNWRDISDMKWAVIKATEDGKFYTSFCMYETSTVYFDTAKNAQKCADWLNKH